METNMLGTTDTEQEMEDSDDHQDNDMEHNDGEEAPDDMKAAAQPEFAVGSQVIIQADHMKGMKGAKATVSGAYDTTVYSVSYTPTNGGQPVSNHKWVVHEEIEDASATPYKVGDQVVLDADHMQGMDGAHATIDSAQQTTVYMVDYTPTEGGQPVKNHKWLIGDELSANQ
ncbi:YdhK family protein [Paenibacillus kandeliae]|uniref:YdhK family protein n=1 Tax=Paenibacillus kandeliae TaxID=3231269 RepID=UPI003F53B5E3